MTFPTEPPPSQDSVDVTLQDPPGVDQLPRWDADAPANPVRRWWDTCKTEAHTIPEAFTTPPNLMDAWTYARRAAFTTRDDAGLLRKLNIAWAAIATGIAAPLLAALWAVQRFGRAVVFIVCLLLIGTGLAQIPVLGAIVPNFLNITAW